MEVAQGKREIIPEKVRKIPRRVRSAPNRILKPFCTHETPRSISMNATLTNIYLIQKIKQRLFLY
jgi:hypothetical protein